MVTGVACAFGVGDGFFRTYQYLNNAEYYDAGGWFQQKYGTTVGMRTSTVMGTQISVGVAMLD